MAEFPIIIEDANREIKALISEKGLDVITSKMIRKHLEAKFKCDFEEHKSNLDVQIESCIMEMTNEEKKVTNAKKEKIEVLEKEKMKKERSPSTASSDSEDGLSKIKIKNDVINSTSSNVNKSKSAQKRKVNAKNVDAAEDDMATAIKRRRSNAVIPKKKEKKAKTKEKSTKNKGKGGMFTNICALSPELSSLLGKRYSRRSDVVKEMWNYLRTHNLQDPKNKQFYYLDEPLKKIFGKSAKRIKAFGMMGKLKCHVKDIRNLDEATRQIAEAEIAEMLANGGESEATNESTSGQQLDDDDDDSMDMDVDQDEESNEGKELSEVKIEADESNISYSSRAKSEEYDAKQPSTSTSAYQQEERVEDDQNQNGGGQNSSDTSSESETSSDDSGHDF